MAQKVLIINSNSDYDSMFEDMNWEVLAGCFPSRLPALIQFTGGEDVSPCLYYQKSHYSTKSCHKRDLVETFVFKWGLSKDIPMAGICRGGQFLNVMCGGNMWQDVDRHEEAHLAEDFKTKRVFIVSSTHHQVMIPCKDAQIVLTAYESTKKERYLPGGKLLRIDNCSDYDIEAIHYKREKVFCFQPHPEFSSSEELRVIYFEYMNNLIL